MEVRPGYKQAEVGVIPEDWEVQHLGNVAAITTGWKDVNEGNPAGEYPFFTCSRSRTFSDHYSFDTEAILIAGNGDVGNLHYYSGRFEAYQRTYVVHKFSHPVRYLWHQLDYRLIESLGLGKIGTSIPYIKKENLTGFAFPVPATEPEQEAIAEALSDADALIESLEYLLAKKRQLKQGAMQELLRPTPSDDVRLLGDVSSLKGRIGWQGLKQVEFTTNDDQPFLITGMNFKDGAIRWSEVYHISEARYEMAPEIQLRPNDVLMTKDGTIGKVLYIDTIPCPGQASLNSHLLLFRPIGASYNPRYLYYQLGSRRFKDFVELSKSGTTFFGLSQSAVAAYPVLLPPMAEQARIATVLSDMDTEIAALESKLAKTRQLKQGMMQELLTGRIRLV